MAKLKGYGKLNKAITLPLKQFGIKKARLEEEFMYTFDKEKVSFKLTWDDTDILFDNFVKDRFDYKVKYSFVLSLLHEVGHHKTGDDIDGAVYDFCQVEKARISRELLKTSSKKKIKKLEYQYFNLPDEIMATQWAVNWAKKHPKRIKKMAHKMQAHIMNFYILNEITDD